MKNVTYKKGCGRRIEIYMQVLRNTYAEHTLMPHFGGGEKASVETGG